MQLVLPGNVVHAPGRRSLADMMAAGELVAIAKGFYTEGGVELRMQPDIIIGDFDSLSPEAMACAVGVAPT